MDTDYKPHTVWVKLPCDLKEFDELPAADCILQFINQYGPVCIAQIYNRLGLCRTTVSRAIIVLNRKKLISSEMRPGAYQGREINFYSKGQS